MNYRNPVISGYNPDPSVCRVGEDYYLVTSSFEFFPGVPLYHSRNLVNWEMIGHCLDRKSQLDLEGCRPSGGIFAPTIRHHDGQFYMTTTNVTGGGNFIVHTDDLAKGWSDPAWVDQGGIDPSLCFADDGKVYFTSTGYDSEIGRMCIQMCEVDPVTGRKLTESRNISYGCGGRYPEGPHLYRIGGYFYLMLAEGGTEYGHRETIQRSKDPYGPFEAFSGNPMLSMEQDGREELYCTGHADLFEDARGAWWVVCLGVRTISDGRRRVLLHNLGRETFLAPVHWTDDGWPVAGDRGVIGLDMEADLPAPVEPVVRDFHDDFSKMPSSAEYTFLRNPCPHDYRFDADLHRLVLTGTETGLDDLASPTWIGIRQKGFCIRATVDVDLLKSEPSMRLGITAYYANEYHYEIYLSQQNGQRYVCLGKHIHDMRYVQARQPVGSGTVRLRIESDKTRYVFSFSADGTDFTVLGTGATAGLCTEGTRMMTFTGVFLALFCERGVGVFRDFSVAVLD